MTGFDPSIQDAVVRAAGAIVSARHVVALTGAGISTESGIPDFRSPGGLWSVFDPMEYATLECFVADPEKAWRLFRALGRTVAGKEPNAGHRALAALEGDGYLDGIVTQNIDRLHQAAGSRRVLEIHGNAERLCCLSCGREAPTRLTHLAEDSPAPRCEGCGSVLKPDVVLFGEPVRASEAIASLLASCDLLLVVGTSANVVPAAWLPEQVLDRGGTIVEFNLERCLDAGIFVHGPAGVTLPGTLEAIARRTAEGRS